MSISVSKCILIGSQLALGASMAMCMAGCADALSYSKEDRAAGMTMYNNGNYVEATAAFTNAARQDPRDFKSYYYEGACYAARQDYEQAIAAYRTCLAVMPLTLEGKNSPNFRNKAIDALATSIAHSQSHGIETAALEKKCATTPSAQNQWLLAKVYRYTGDADSAIVAYNKAILIDPNNFAIAKEAGLYELALGQTNRAEFALNKAHEDDPADAQVNDALRGLGVPTSAQPGTSSDLSSLPASTNTGPAWDPNKVHTDAAQASQVQTPRN